MKIIFLLAVIMVAASVSIIEVIWRM